MGETIVLACHIISQRTGKTFCPQNQFSFDINNTVTKPQRKATPCDWISLKINFHLVFSGKIVNPLNEHHAGNSEEYEVINKSTPWKYLWDICCMWSILLITSSLIIAMYPSRMPFSTQGRTHAALSTLYIDTEDLSSYFSPAFQIRHQHIARVSNCLFELHEGAIRSGCKLNFLVDAHPSPCHLHCGSTVTVSITLQDTYIPGETLQSSFIHVNFSFPEWGHTVSILELQVKMHCYSWFSIAYLV